MNFLGFNEFLQLFLAGTTVVLGILTGLSKLKKDDGSWTKQAFYLILLLVLSAMATVGLSFNQAYENKEEKGKLILKQARDSIKNQKEYDSLLWRVTMTLDTSQKILTGVTASIKSLNDLQGKSNLIIGNLNYELGVQKQLNKAANNLIEKSNTLLISQASQIKDADRVLNPVYPFHLYVSYSLSITEPSISLLVERLNILKAKFEADSNLQMEDVVCEYESSKKKVVKELSIRYYEKLFPEIKSLYVSDKGITVGFIKKEDLDTSNPRFVKSILALDAKYPDEGITRAGKRQISRIKIDFKDKEIKFNVYYTEFVFTPYLNRSNKLFGLSDLAGNYVWINMGGEASYSLRKLSFYFGDRFDRPLYLHRLFEDKITIKSYGYLYHQIQESDTKNDNMDDYKIIFYDKGTESLGMPPPTFK